MLNNYRSLYVDQDSYNIYFKKKMKLFIIGPYDYEGGFH